MRALHCQAGLRTRLCSVGWAKILQAGPPGMTQLALQRQWETPRGRPDTNTISRRGQPSPSQIEFLPPDLSKNSNPPTHRGQRRTQRMDDRQLLGRSGLRTVRSELHRIPARCADPTESLSVGSGLHTPALLRPAVHNLGDDPMSDL